MRRGRQEPSQQQGQRLGQHLQGPPLTSQPRERSCIALPRHDPLPATSEGLPNPPGPLSTAVSMAQSGRKKSVLAGVLALSMVLPVAKSQASEPPAPTLVKMAPAPEAAPRVGLRVNAEDLGSGGDPVKAKIEETAKEVFTAEGFEDASG